LIVSLHVATGAAAGATLRSRGIAVVAGLTLHALGDRMPHDDIPSRRFEIVSGAVLLGLVALAHGPLSPAAIGAAASSVPDVEHVLRLWAQLLAAGTLVGVVLGGARH
jgi:hypothetical protein